MAQKYLGDLFDIHCGGEDHIPVHHTNEIAQTEARSGTRLANYWLHGYFLLLDAQKMAKASGEFLRLALLEERGYDPLAYRYFCLNAHYRVQLSFSWEALDGAATALDRLRMATHALGDPGEPDAASVERFQREVNDDLNFPRALAVTWEVARGSLPKPVAKATLLDFDRVLGLGLQRWAPSAIEVPVEVRALAEARQAARLAKDFAEADRLRAQIRELGYDVKDTAGGFELARR
jgi:cysteinyl-tRNA synthetase